MIIVRIGLGLTSVSGESGEFGKVSTLQTAGPGGFGNSGSKFGVESRSDKTLGEFMVDNRSESPTTRSSSYNRSHNGSSEKISV